MVWPIWTNLDNLIVFQTESAENKWHNLPFLRRRGRVMNVKWSIYDHISSLRTVGKFQKAVIKLKYSKNSNAMKKSICTLFPRIMVHALKYETTYFLRWQSRFAFKCMHQIMWGQVHAPLSETTTKRKIWRTPVWQKHAFANVISILCLWYLLGLPSDSLVYEKQWIKYATLQLRAGAPKKLIGVALVG